MEEKKKRPGAATALIDKSQIMVDEVVRYTPHHEEGLSLQQVEVRQKQKLTNVKPNKGVKSVFSILASNLFSFFNIILYVIAAALLYIGEYESLFFLGILIANISIGLVQDFRARATLKKLLILNEHRVLVIRGGKEYKIPAHEVVLDDIIKLKLGDQIVADGYLIHGSVGVNEALLTGEPDIVHKEEMNRVLSGSFVTMGTCYYQVDTIGKLGYAQKLQLRAKVFKRPKSELLNSIQKLFRLIGTIVIVMAMLLVFNGFYQGANLHDNIKSIAGSLIAMIPSGMYLLTSATLAVGVVRLGIKKVLVNEMYSIEMLARVNVLCLDKTGTITDGTMKVNEVVLLNATAEEVNKYVTSILNATLDENPTAKAMREYFSSPFPNTATKTYPFTSANKYSGALIDKNTYLLGASSYVLSARAHNKISALERTYLEKGLRVLVLAVSSKGINNKKLPTDLVPMALIIIQDNIRSEAIEAIRHFQENGVEIKIISGDDPISVGEIARQVGIVDSHKTLDFSNDEQREAFNLNDFAVYGRVRPEQKEGIISGLQKEGKVVAMIGDGVNDVLALKAASCSIAMGTGSGAARGVSHLVLMNDDFAALPSIVDEGRRAINNLQKTWSLFLVKTIFAILFSLLFVTAGLLGPKDSGIRYPFEPKHLYLWEFLFLGIPSFFLSMQPNKDRVEGTFLNNIMRRSLPAGLTLVGAAFTLYITKNFEEMLGTTVSNTSIPMITMSIFTITLISFVILYHNARPLNRNKIILLSLLAIVAAGLVALDNTIGFSREGVGQFFGIDFSSLNWLNYLVMGLVIIFFGGIYVYVDYKLVPKPKRRSKKDAN